MIRAILLVCSLALLTSICLPDFGYAEESKSTQPEGREEWRERLLAANQEVAIAQKRSDTALRTYQTMRHRRRPRGDGKQAIMDELHLANEQLANAQQQLEKLESAARRAGAPPSWLEFDPAEINAAVPASPEP